MKGIGSQGGVCVLEADTFSTKASEVHSAQTLSSSHNENHRPSKQITPAPPPPYSISISLPPHRDISLILANYIQRCREQNTRSPRSEELERGGGESNFWRLAKGVMISIGIMRRQYF